MTTPRSEYLELHVPTTPAIVCWVTDPGLGAAYITDYKVFLMEDHANHIGAAQEFYHSLLELDTTYSANFTLVIESTDYDC